MHQNHLCWTEYQNVGQISQTVQCVVSGKTKGTAYFKAKVVRDLSKLYQADCLAGKQLYDKLMDPTPSTTKEVKPRGHNKNTSKQSMTPGINDSYTNISTVIVNETCHDDSTDLEDTASNASHDAMLGNFLAEMTDDARAQAVYDYPELANHTKQGVDIDNTSSEDDLVRFLAMQAADDYQEVALQDLAAGHGYHDAVPSPDFDQVSLHSDTAEFFCRLCQASDQPNIITFSHDLLDPECPSMDYDDPYEEDDA